MENTPKAKISLKDTPWLKCSEGSMVFDHATMFKRVSSLISPTGKEELIPVETMVCKRCNKIPRFFYEKIDGIPEDMKSPCTFDGTKPQSPHIIQP